MHIARPRLLSALTTLLLLAACSHAPTRDEAQAAIRAAQPALDSATVRERVWQDGPPWFSCAEVLAKVGKPVDSAVVRDQVGNWKALVASGWIVLRDSAKGPVADPGWCTARVTAAGQANVARWTVEPGPLFPTGAPRRGWSVVVGRQRLLVPRGASAQGDDAATAEFGVTVTPNPDGVATGAGRDTAWFVAELRRVDGAWRMTSSRPRPAER